MIKILDDDYQKTKITEISLNISFWNYYCGYLGIAINKLDEI